MHTRDSIPIVRRRKTHSPVRREFHHGQVTVRALIRRLDQGCKQFEIVLRNHPFSFATE
jgi:hypothetical protein